jgi:hypothetical protein
MNCPSRNCAAGQTDQRMLTIRESNAVSPQNWLSIAQICKRCGCVHSAGDVRGHLTVKGWARAA